MKRLLDARHVHIIGIGGAGMSPLAYILLAMGKQVSGSDLRLSAVTAGLQAAGAAVYEGHRRQNVAGADLVVVTSAARDDNLEIWEAREAGIPVVKGSQLLGAMMHEKEGIAVAGTHGKTTTTAMITLLLVRAGLDPTFVVGGEVRDLGASGRLGAGRLLVAEADEYDERFLQLQPRIAVVTNIDADHLDFYGSTQNLRFAFRRFCNNIEPGGWLVACGDDPWARELGEAHTQATVGGLKQFTGLVRGSVVFYGLHDDVDYQATQLRLNGQGGYDFVAGYRGQPLGAFSTAVPGQHNVLNALAAIAVGRLLDVDMAVIRDALASYHGAGRRFEIKGEVNGVTIVDDYAHHPTEIKATLAAARERFPGRRLVAVHEPHTFSRVRHLLLEFATAFDGADIVLMCDIYPSREIDDGTVHGRDLVTAMQHPGARYAGTLDEAEEALRTLLQPGDVLLTLGAGNVTRVGSDLLHVWQQTGGR